ncbi:MULTISPECIES: helix-turn-helix domain-containing protein [unclassified Helicobacter]|uniref:helix-turn-helix domain-containing protein n=1 Tax=unclassified Helicobacter TaxID=2593540 RepID=UPI0006921C62|nr:MULTISPECIES: helix-turn-helix domain-containing protein [unclassified Helicobacter]
MIHKTKITQNFTIVPNDVIKDSSLSIGARMLYTLILSFPKEWNLNIAHLAKLLNISENTARKYRNELVNANIITFKQELDSQGKFTHNFSYSCQNLEIENIQEIQEHSQSYPFNKKPVCGKNEDIINNNIINNKDYSKRLLFVVMESFRQFSDTKKPKSQKLTQDEMLSHLNTQEKQAYYDFISYRKEKGFVAKSTMISITKDFLSLKNVGADLRECVDLCINRGWSGIMCAHKSLTRKLHYPTYAKPKQNDALANLEL